jgi:hypothetical protein
MRANRYVAFGILTVFLAGCSPAPSNSSRDILTRPQPWHGKLHQADAAGKMIQAMVWEHGTLRSCWEYQSGKWTQTVIDGSGYRTLYYKSGEPAGHEDYANGEYTGGAG